MPQLDPSTFPTQLVWLALTFIILYVLMAKVALPRVSRVLDQRQTRIEDNLDKAQALRDEAQETAEAYERSLAEARDQARAVIHEASLQAAMDASRSLDELTEKIAVDIKEAEVRIAAAKEEAVSGIRGAAIEVALSATERLLGTAPSEAAAAAALDAHIEEGS